MDNTQTFKANGKLLISGEYLVLYGAKALAMPVNKGQQLRVQSHEAVNPEITWEAFKTDGLWFKARFNLADLSIIETSNSIVTNKLQLILITLSQLNPKIFSGKLSYHFTTEMNFNPEWGFGSSSTLIVMLARWAKVNPYTLLNFSIGGSGYDIACAQVSHPIIYKLKGLQPNIQPASFDPPFKSNLYFVYQGNKQDSARAIQRFREETAEDEIQFAVEQMNHLTDKIIQTKSYDDFCKLIFQHEKLISKLIDLQPIQKQFPDFKGSLKSLGAWGGDFLLAASQENKQDVKKYFEAKGLLPIFRFDELTL
ncbi:MAG TPA: GYDIA family GHMP kinase [Bacteroidales bacterium]|nr:GYDIA family GHMP kinase [Bacteroidales bacterium]